MVEAGGHHLVVCLEGEVLTWVIASTASWGMAWKLGNEGKVDLWASGVDLSKKKHENMHMDFTKMKSKQKQTRKLYSV
jgi:hypothetical protein